MRWTPGRAKLFLPSEPVGGLIAIRLVIAVLVYRRVIFGKREAADDYGVIDGFVGAMVGSGRGAMGVVVVRRIGSRLGCPFGIGLLDATTDSLVKNVGDGSIRVISRRGSTGRAGEELVCRSCAFCLDRLLLVGGSGQLQDGRALVRVLVTAELPVGLSAGLGPNVGRLNLVVRPMSRAIGLPGEARILA